MILIHILFGIICACILFLIIHYSKRRNITVKTWHWIVIVLEIFYILFVLELIAGFIEEGSPKGAVVMGSIFGLIAIIGAVLIWRFILKIKGESKK